MDQMLFPHSKLSHLAIEAVVLILLIFWISGRFSAQKEAFNEKLKLENEELRQRIDTLEQASARNFSQMSRILNQLIESNLAAKKAPASAPAAPPTPPSSPATPSVEEEEEKEDEPKVEEKQDEPTPAIEEVVETKEEPPVVAPKKKKTRINAE